jgi:hypothetical protein
MAFMVNKPQSNGTKLDGPPPSAAIVKMTITGIKDLGMVPVDPKFPRQDGKTSVHKAEVIFSSVAGEQAKKDYTVSLHEKAGLRALIIAATGTVPAESFDIDQLIGTNVQVVGQKKVSQKGNPYYKITSVVPGDPSQPVAKAPAPKPQAAAVGTPAVNPGW